MSETGDATAAGTSGRRSGLERIARQTPEAELAEVVDATGADGSEAPFDRRAGEPAAVSPAG